LSAPNGDEDVAAIDDEGYTVDVDAQGALLTCPSFTQQL
jgi:hypothetical protein